VAALEVAAGDVVFVSGATGGVGAFAVQLLVSLGAHVIASARPGPASDFVRGLGAADVVDYSGDLFTALSEVAPNGVTKVLHAAGDAPMLARLLASGGQLASLRGATAEQVGRGDVTVTAVTAKYTPEKLGGLLQQVATGDLTVPIGGRYVLADAAAALADFSGAKLGKVVVTMP
jgi:NADPH:quinone reductase-like Zn-dependent oxidoreductase